ncbi:uncharacterized protein LOC106457895 [Limulus polyphemus]|uniref:Uncharacterized protein LOC106457895 n=1 Tax=Limulus polyphemus TaxID=6850 RepID=A0ABM1S7R0_LIMPO|nr:uncharacterized protein LOC106457895 [Limulus polyphemus]XP_022239666.1 uncharacterized protein LOC106457895 [Limulus polyphemus]XP_022239667.1 uncharacterized protein LOC106457895 [Limulus polyphemus]
MSTICTPSAGMLPFIAFALSLVSIVLQLVALPSDYWAVIYPQNDSEHQVQKGNYGLWTKYIRSFPHSAEQKTSADFPLPPHSVAAGVMAVVHLLMQLAFLPAAVTHCVQVVKDDQDLILNAKILNVVKVVLSILAIFSSLLVIVFITVEENQSFETKVYKGPAFWVQNAVVSSNVVLSFVCSLEDVRHTELGSTKKVEKCPSQVGVTEQYSNPSYTP